MSVGAARELPPADPGRCCDARENEMPASAGAAARPRRLCAGAGAS